MPDHKTQSEIYAYGLIHGLINTSEVIEWSEHLLEAEEKPDDWLLNLCGSNGKSDKEVLSILHSIPGICNKEIANCGIVELISRQSKPFKLFPAEVLPQGFRYPEKLDEISTSGKYLYNPSVYFIKSDSENEKLLLNFVKNVKSSFVPFAQLDDDFLCLDAAEENSVFVVDIVDKKSSCIGDFESWLYSYNQEAKKGWDRVGT